VPLDRRSTSLAENPRVFDAVQRLVGQSIVYRRIARVLAPAPGETVLDVGAGTGNLARILPAEIDYWALDNDPAKLHRLAQKVPRARALQCTALDIEMPDAAVDWTVCVAVAHHLDDRQLPLLVAELARVTRQRLIFLDPLAATGPGTAALLWRYDRGSHPRSERTLLDRLSRCFEFEHVERFRVFHRYVLCSARPIGAHSADHSSYEHRDRPARAAGDPRRR
jgi:SAM-dependent methyltransferase